MAGTPMTGIGTQEGSDRCEHSILLLGYPAIDLLSIIVLHKYQSTETMPNTRRSM